VVTQTANLHAAAWTRLFDDYLRQRAAGEGRPFRPSDLSADYRRYVDGKPRYEGVRSVLQSRGIALPDGEPSDDPARETVCGLGNRQNTIFLELLKMRGVEVFDSTVALLHALRGRGLKTTVISSSKNCAEVLEAAGLTDLFETRVDGVDLTRLRLAGKPALIASSQPLHGLGFLKYALWSWRTPLPAFRPGGMAGLAWLSASPDRGSMPPSGRGAPTSWSMTYQRSSWTGREGLRLTPDLLQRAGLGARPA
jgi:beta-phosphoglucomutase-like phosphatase (HAD superfamily)